MFRRFCNMFSRSSPCLLGQHGSCSIGLWNSQKTVYKTFGTSGRPTKYKSNSKSLLLCCRYFWRHFFVYFRMYDPTGTLHGTRCHTRRGSWRATRSRPTSRGCSPTMTRMSLKSWRSVTEHSSLLVSPEVKRVGQAAREHYVDFSLKCKCTQSNPSLLTILYWGPSCTGWFICPKTWVGLTRILGLPLFAQFCLGRFEFGRRGCTAGQDGGTPKSKSTQPRS